MMDPDTRLVCFKDTCEELVVSTAIADVIERIQAVGFEGHAGIMVEAAKDLLDPGSDYTEDDEGICDLAAHWGLWN